MRCLRYARWKLRLEFDGQKAGSAADGVRGGACDVQIQRGSFNYNFPILEFVGMTPEGATFVIQYAPANGIIYHVYAAKVALGWIKQISGTFSVPYRVSN